MIAADWIMSRPEHIPRGSPLETVKTATGETMITNRPSLIRAARARVRGQTIHPPLQPTLAAAVKAQAEGDVVAMVRIYPELEGCK